MGNIIRQEIMTIYPDANVHVVHDTTTDPYCSDEMEVLIANTFPPGLLMRCHRLQWLHLTGAGFDHILLEQLPPNLIVTNSATVPAQAVAEFVWMGLLALAKDAVQLVQQQERHEWRLPNSCLVAGSQMVLVGLGNIGTEIARRARAFNIKVTAITRRALPSPLVERVFSPERLIEAVSQADSLVLAVPATPTTYHLIDETIIRALPPNAVIINVARSSVLDTNALVSALQAGQLRGALLDVHDDEPLQATSPLWDVRGLWITPHGAYRFAAEELEIARLFIANLECFSQGKKLRNLVNGNSTQVYAANQAQSIEVDTPARTFHNASNATDIHEKE